METRLQQNSLRLLLSLAFSILMPAILVFSLARALAAGSEAPSTRQSRERLLPRSLYYQTGLSVCAQTINLVPNPDFEQGLSGWTEGGKECTFSTIQPGYNSATSAVITGCTTGKSCMLLTTIDEIPVEPGRFYDYRAWIRADLVQGDACLAITFWRLHKRVWKPAGGGEQALTAVVTDTQGAWVEATGSVQAPPDAEFARVEVTIGEFSEGTAWFDGIFFGLATCLDVSKSDDPHHVVAGQWLTYTIIYSSTGREKATDLQVIETYDPDVDVSLTQTHPLPDISNNIWEVGELLPGHSGTITVVVQVDEVEGHNWLLNLVGLYSDEIDESSIPILADVSTHVITPVNCAMSLGVDKGSKSGMPGQTVNYYLELCNIGDCDGQIVPTATSSLNWALGFSPPTCTSPIGHLDPMTLNLTIPPTEATGVRNTTLITVTLTCSWPYGNEHVIVTRTVDTAIVPPVFLPVVMKNYYDTSRWESEPNNTCSLADADGPLELQREYYGYTDDEWDWFRIETPQGQVAVDLTIYFGTGVQVLLADPGCVEVDKDTAPAPAPEGGYLYHVEYAGDPQQYHRYYLGIYTASGYDQGYDRPYVIWRTH